VITDLFKGKKQGGGVEERNINRGAWRGKEGYLSVFDEGNLEGVSRGVKYPPVFRGELLGPG